MNRFLFAIAAILLSFRCSPLLAQKLVYIENGVLDLSDWKIETNPTLEIRGKWLWYPHVFAESVTELEASLIPAQKVDPMFEHDTLKRDRWGSFYLQIKFPTNIAASTYGIWFENFTNNVTAIFEGSSRHRQSFSKGKPSSKSEEEVASAKNRIFFFYQEQSTTHLIVNRSFNNNALYGITILGTAEGVKNELTKKYWLATWVIGMLCLIGLYNLSIYFLNRSSKANLIHFWTSAFLVIRQFSTSGILSDLLPVQDSIEYYFQIAAVVYGQAAAVSFPILAISYTFGHKHLKRISIYLLLIQATIATVVINAGVPDSQILLFIAFLSVVLTLVVTLYTLIKSFAKDRQNYFLAICSILALILGFGWDSAVTLYNFNLPYIADYSLVIMIFLQSQITGLQFSKAFRKAEHLSRNLSEEVKKHTEKLSLQKEKLEEQKKELVEAHAVLQNLDQQKTRFFQNISHEIRTPLTLILSSQKSLLKTFSNNEDVQVAERNARRLLRLVNQLLDFQKLTQSDQRLRLCSIHLNHFLQSCIDYIRKSCETKGICLSIDGLDSENAYILGQADALEKVVFNYLSNALKYTPAGGRICLGMQLNGFNARIYVKDSGPGIDDKGKERLFKIFSQVDDSDKRAQEGTGLGLALVKELVSKMDGTVGVDSEVGQGSCFWAEFPIINEDRQMELLLVDDDVAMLEEFTLQLALRTSITRMQCAGTAEEALELIQRYRFACVLSDAVLPGMDGPSFLLEVSKQQPQAHRMLVTARQESHRLVQKAINVAKIDKVLYKPLGDEIYSIIEAAVEEKSKLENKAVYDLLLVDDDPQILSVLTRQLEEHTLIERYITAKSMAEAKKILHKYTFKAVLSDADLGGGDTGAELLAFILSTEPRTKRIMLTGERGTDTLGEAINQAKIDHIFYKPIDFIDLKPILIKAIESSEIQDNGQATDQTLEIKDWHLADVESPSEEDNETGASPDTTPHSHRDNLRGKVVVCDDVRDMRNLMLRCLRRAGYEAVPATNGKVGLNLIKDVQPDLVVTDWMMPVMTGPELIAALHADEALSSIPTILLTAKTDEESKLIGTKVGATAYLAKPFDELELETTANNLVDLKKGERRIAELNRYLTETVLCRYLPPKLVEQVLRGERVLQEAATTQAVTILFSDLCNFTELSEEMGPRKISTVLNHFFESMSQIIFDHGGTIDKFIGDAIMVIFGAPEILPAQEQIKLACDCARKMQRALAVLNKHWQKEGLSAFTMRIGMHHGPAVVGQFGSELRSEYTAIGPTVNLASRIEAKAEPGTIFVSAAIRDYLDDGWQKAGRFELKGIGEVALFKLSWCSEGGIDDEAA